MSATAIPAVQVPAWIVSVATPASVTRATREITASTRLTNARDTIPASMECAPTVKPTIFATASQSTVAKIVR